ncbi:MAG: acetyl-CoA hydrolase/transferase family protein [Methylocystaceae bacterium]
MRNSAGLKIEKCSNWQADYQSKLCSPEQAAALVKSGDVISLSGGTSVPVGFCEALGERAAELKGVTLLMGFALRKYQVMQPELHDSFHIETVFVGQMERQCIKAGNASYVPIHLQQVGAWLDNRKPNMVAVTVTPPDEDGYMNRTCYAALTHRRAFQAADTVVVEVNPETPWLNGQDFKIHVSEVDHIIEQCTPITEIQDIPITDTEREIAGHISEMIPDGATIQLGLGGLANAIGYMLRDKRDLGMHAEVVSNSVMELMKCGAVNGSRKTYMPGKVVGTYCVGNRELFEFVDHNPDFEFCEVETTNDPLIIARNENLISINNALMIDLTGQVASESIGHYQYSGTGGQVNFVQGARLSPGGISILALSSTYRDNKGNIQSRILPDFPVGTVVTTSRCDVQYVVTEFGVASLQYKSIAERVRQLVLVAHPDYREELIVKARKAGWI